MPAGQDRDTGAGDRKQARPAFDALIADGWHCRLGRRLIETFPFDALIAYSAACAWRERGPAWGEPREDGSIPRESAETPPGGWPALAGVTDKTWAGWRGRAIREGLLREKSGEPRRKRARRFVPLLRPVLPEVLTREQHARIPAAVMFHVRLTVRAKRLYAALALRADKQRKVTVAHESLVNDTGFDRRDTIRQLDRLEAAGVIERGAQSNRYGVRPILLRDTGEITTPENARSRKIYHPSPGKITTPDSEKLPPLTRKIAHPSPGKSTTQFKNLSQESNSGIDIQEIAISAAPDGAAARAPAPAPDPDSLLSEIRIRRKQLADMDSESPVQRRLIENRIARLAEQYAAVTGEQPA